MKPDHYDPIAAALKEDIGDGDITTDSFVPETLHERVGRNVAVADVLFKSRGDWVVMVWLHAGRNKAHNKCEMRAGLLGARVSNVLGRLGQVRGARRARTLDRVRLALCLKSDKKRFGQSTLRRNNESRKSCYHPNRLNLLALTAGYGLCSNFLRRIRV